MNKSDLVAKVSEQASVSKTDVESVMGALVEVVSAAVSSGDSVTVPGLGTFEKRDRAARTGRNPQTGESMEIAATSVPGFKAAAPLKRRVAGN